MLSYFPSLLFLSPLSTSMIRAAVAFVLIYVAYRTLTTAQEYMQQEFPIIGKPNFPLMVVAASIAGAMGVGLLLGAWTQPLALLSSIAAIKLFILERSYPSLAPLSRGTIVLFFIMSVSLIFSGAGAFAFDLPL